jgi:predicted enzyme related to lactoylglutathione lyase
MTRGSTTGSMTGSTRLAVRPPACDARGIAGPNRTRRFCQNAIVAAALGVAAVSPAVATPPPMPALMQPPAQDRHVGKVVWMQLVTPDLAAAKTFYGSLFGWTFRDIGAPEYAEADLNGHPVAGLFHRPIKPGEHRQPAWFGYISTSDADATTRTALQHGARLLFGPHDVPDLGRDAVLADPQGAVFAVLASSTGDPPDVLPDPGGWIWGSLITGDPDAAAGFYQTLFGYDVFSLPSDNGAEHLLLSSGDYARVSVNSIPTGAVNPHPHWLNYVRVDDAVATATKVVALGGRVLVAPRVDHHGGKVAVMVDPQGALFGLLEWPETAGREVTK